MSRKGCRMTPQKLCRGSLFRPSMSFIAHVIAHLSSDWMELTQLWHARRTHVHKLEVAFASRPNQLVP